MKKNILQMSMIERFKYLNEEKRKKFNVRLNNIEERTNQICESCGNRLQK